MPVGSVVPSHFNKARGVIPRVRLPAPFMRELIMVVRYQALQDRWFSLQQRRSADGSSRHPHPVDGMPMEAFAPLSRVVIRDKTSPIPSVSGGKTLPDPDFAADKVSLRSRGPHLWAVPILTPQPLPTAEAKVAFLDWLGFSLVADRPNVFHWISHALLELTGLQVTDVSQKGWNGYAFMAQLGDCGLIAWGGESQKGTVHVELNGTGCRRVTDWEPLRQWAEAHQAWISRIDLAHDDMNGDWLSVDAAVQWLAQDGFHNNGRPAVSQLAGDWLGGMKGRTLYVGTRASKLCRVYEKGKQLGMATSRWCRVEVMWRNKNRALPWDMLARPGAYLAGAYPCLAGLSVEQLAIRSTQRSAALSEADTIAHARRLSGRVVNLLWHKHHGDAEAVVQALRRAGLPKRLQPYRDVLLAPSPGSHHEDA